VSAINGTTYYARAYYTQDGLSNYLTGLSYSYPSSNALNNTYGLLLQILITLAAASLAIASPALASVIVPLSLVLGSWLGLNALGAGALTAIVGVGLIMAYFWSVNK
jgi:hypothetical protein